jgi:predicted DNA-binding protein (MmcQ/YjbR family)
MPSAKKKVKPDSREPPIRKAEPTAHPTKPRRPAAAPRVAAASQRKARKVAGGLLAVEQALRAYALAMPGAYEEFPWGERAIKVQKKVFLFMRADATVLGLSAKLPHSRWAALELPFAEPTHYGLGKSGWVSAQFSKGEDPPQDLLKAWIDESYRAVAPKRLLEALPGA